VVWEEPKKNITMRDRDYTAMKKQVVVLWAVMPHTNVVAHHNVSEDLAASIFRISCWYFTTPLYGVTTQETATRRRVL
jgi:hypothetical protein